MLIPLIAAAALATAIPATPSGIDVSHVKPVAVKSALSKGWNRDAAFMEIFVRSYQDSDSDGIGDFKGLTSRLDYLKSLGVTGIWLMPVMPSADHDHGYAVNDYRAIDPDYGTMQDFETFVAEAHKRGIGVILDFVCNHSGSGNAIFRSAAASKTSPYRDWYVFSDQNPGWYNPNMRGVSGAYYNDPWMLADKAVPGGQGYFYGVFSRQMPDWNLKNPKVVTYLQDTMRFWMNKGVDGFRLDAVTMLIEDGPTSYFNNPANPGIVGQLRKTVDEYDNRYMICEVSEGQALFTKVCNAFAYGVQGAIIDSTRKGAVDAKLIAQLQNPDRAVMPLALQSHDSYVGDRLIDQFGVNGEAEYRLAAAISILVSDTPFSYYGEEIGMSNGGTFDDPGLRSPMSWDSSRPAAGFSTKVPYRRPAINFASMNVAAEAKDPRSLLSAYKVLYNVRREHPVLGLGAFTLVSKAGDPALVFTRRSADDEAVVMINLSTAPQTLIAPVTAAALYQALDGGKGAPATVTNGQLTVTVPAQTTYVFTR